MPVLNLPPALMAAMAAHAAPPMAQGSVLPPPRLSPLVMKAMKAKAKRLKKGR